MRQALLLICTVAWVLCSVSSSTVCGMVVYNNTACTSNAYAQSVEADADACCALCCNDPHCVLWSFHPKSAGGNCDRAASFESKHASPASTCGMKASPPSPSPPAPPPPHRVAFSWSTVPLYYQFCSVNGTVAQEIPSKRAAWLARFPLVVLEHCQGQGPQAYIGQHGPEPYMPNNGYIEDHYWAAAAELKKVNASMTVLYYQNMDAALPYFRYAAPLATHKEWRVLGQGSTGGHMFPDLKTWIWNHDEQGVQDAWLHSFINMTGAGSPFDGTFIDTAAAPSSPSRQKLLAQLQAARPAKIVGFHTASIPNTYSSTMIYNFAASEGFIKWLMDIAESSIVALVHAQTAMGTCSQCGHVRSALAAFLIGAGERTYFAFSAKGDPHGPGAQGPDFCDPHSQTAPTFPTWCSGMGWTEEFDRPLGAPLSKAKKMSDGTWVRQFGAGTNVSLNIANKACRIDWADGGVSVCESAAFESDQLVV